MNESTRTGALLAAQQALASGDSKAVSDHIAAILAQQKSQMEIQDRLRHANRVQLAEAVQGAMPDATELHSLHGHDGESLAKLRADRLELREELVDTIARVAAAPPPPPGMPIKLKAIGLDTRIPAGAVGTFIVCAALVAGAWLVRDAMLHRADTPPAAYTVTPEQRAFMDALMERATPRTGAQPPAPVEP